MDTCDVLIVGGGPAGSSCAWALRNSGLNVLILDKHKFPRDKICGGWITPAVITELGIDTSDYSRGRLLQPITGFRTGWIGGRTIDSDYGTVASYGIRRREFDAYLLRRSGARTMEGVALASLERHNGGWIVNENIRARLIVGAGGHFCPVAKLTGARRTRENPVVAQEIEFEMSDRQSAACRLSAEVPELYFCPDMKGYGWCFRKQNFVNIGLGRMDQHRLKDHVDAFVRYLRASGRVGFDLPPAFPGHAYLLYGVSQRKPVDDGLLLIGDAVGLAYKQSGEGIRPAIESGLLAAKAILAANGQYSREHLEPYRQLLARRFGVSGRDWASSVGQQLPSAWIGALGRALLRTRWFARGVVIDRWFLHANEPALEQVL